MSYFSVYKNRIKRKGSNIRESRERDSKNLINRNFESIDGYKEATLLVPNDYNNNSDVGSPFDLVIHSTQDELKKYFMLRPDTKIPNGSYVSINNENRTYIVNTVDMDNIAPSATVYLCNEKLKMKGCPFIFPIYENSTTFGTKGIVDNGGSKFLELDSKTRAYVQYNKFTDKIPLGYRFIFKNKYVYSVTEVDHMVYDHLIMTLRITERHPDDDFENEIAWNETDIDFSDLLDDKQIQETYILDGKFTLSVGESEEYFSNNTVAQWDINKISGDANIISEDNVSIHIRGTTKGVIELVATLDNGGRATKNILIT